MGLSRLFIVLLIIRCVESISYPCNSTATCGCSQNSATVTRIVGGELAAAATWSWAVSLAIAPGFLCGGSILSQFWVVTAAHCVKDVAASAVTVYAGSNQQWRGTQTRRVSRIFVHPSYNTVTFTNDIALLQLSVPFDINDSAVATICLPSVDSTTLANSQWPAIGISVVAVGWGTTTDGGSLPGTLRQVTVTTIDRQVPACSRSISNWQVQMCAGIDGGGKDTCQGDSGGPLMMFSSSNRWVLVGLTSNGHGCALAGYSGVYTRVAPFTDWIRSYVNDTNVEMTSTSTRPCLSAIFFFVMWICLAQ